MTMQQIFHLLTDPLGLFYGVCLIVGGTFTIIQFLLMFIGFDGGDGVALTDVSIEHPDTIEIFKILSIRSVIAGIAFFGLGGLSGLCANLGKPISFLLAIIFGLAAVAAVYYLYRSLDQLKADGTVSEKTLVGAAGSVYVKIPGNNGGVGKVLLSQQGRTMEYEAMTLGSELATGTPISVVRIVSSTVVEVK